VASRDEGDEVTEELKHHRQQTATAVVVKNGDVFFLAQPDGQVPAAGDHALGLYYHDCRFLDGYELALGDREPDVLVADSGEGFRAAFELTNRDLETERGSIGRQQVGICWERCIDGAVRTLHDVLTIRNFGVSDIELPLSLTLRSHFEDIFVVRGWRQQKAGTLHRACWEGERESLVLQYDGADGWRRRLTVHFSPRPDSADATTARFRVSLASAETKQIAVSLVISEEDDYRPHCTGHRVGHAVAAPPPSRLRALRDQHQRSVEGWLEHRTQMETDDRILNAVLSRSLRDLHVLTSTLRDRCFFAAGVPWYVTLFGRDSLTAALQTSPSTLTWRTPLSACLRATRGSVPMSGGTSSRGRSRTSSGSERWRV
jgi:glycogen debranching enzyme